MSNRIIRNQTQQSGKWLYWTILLFICTATVGFSKEPQTLSALLQKAHPGDYVVTESGKVITLIRIHAITPQSITFEEISAPAKHLAQKRLSWPEWVKAKAPGHTSWSITEIGWESGQILKCYSFSRHAYLQVSAQESLMATLLQRELLPVSADERRRIGSAPEGGDTDHRQYWNPPLVFQGEKEKQASFDVFKTTWPQDGSALEGEKLTFYFDRELKIPFPYWIELQTAHAALQVQTIDSGNALVSPLTSGSSHQKERADRAQALRTPEGNLHSKTLQIPQEE